MNKNWVGDAVTLGYSQAVRQRTLTPSFRWFESIYPNHKHLIGVSPSGKATDSDSVIPKVRILPPQPEMPRSLRYGVQFFAALDVIRQELIFFYKPSTPLFCAVCSNANNRCTNATDKFLQSMPQCAMMKSQQGEHPEIKGGIIMTLGEKIKEARKNAGLTQEQLAQKLVISRQAITKWESDKGLPDIQNLKALAELLNVSVDYLLDDGQSAVKTVMRESIDLDKYGKKGFNDKRKDKLISERYPNAEIIRLIADATTKSDRVIDNIIGFVTDAPFGIPKVISQMNNIDNEYYLVNDGSRQLLVLVTSEFIESRELSERVNDKKFTVGEITFKKLRKI